jgi:hypothetical protein
MKPFTTIAVVLFVLMALAHLVRLFTGWTVVVNGFDVPTWVSLPGLVIAGGLAAMLRREAMRSGAGR